jgi:hypothetical protein
MAVSVFIKDTELKMDFDVIFVSVLFLKLYPNSKKVIRYSNSDPNRIGPIPIKKFPILW